jgi:hypothetical protein
MKTRLTGTAFFAVISLLIVIAALVAFHDIEGSSVKADANADKAGNANRLSRAMSFTDPSGDQK